MGRRARQELVGRALDEAADRPRGPTRRSSGGTSPSACRRCRTAARPRAGSARASSVRSRPALLGQHDQRALGRVADHLAGRGEHRVAGERQREHELLQRDLGLAGDVLDLALGRVAGAGDRVAAARDRQLDRGHLVERQRAGLVGADRRGGAERLGRAQALDDRVGLGQQARAAREDRRDDRRQARRDRRDRERHRDGEDLGEALPARHVEHDRRDEREPGDRDELLGQLLQLHGQRGLRRRPGAGASRRCGRPRSPSRSR